MRIDGSVAWITGGSSGIGASLARELAAHGATVAITARRAGLLEQVAATAEGSGSVHAYPGDVRDRDGLLEITGRIHRDLGPIDLAVLNAGTWTQVDVANWDSSSIR